MEQAVRRIWDPESETAKQFDTYLPRMISHQGLKGGNTVGNRRYAVRFMVALARVQGPHYSTGCRSLTHMSGNDSPEVRFLGFGIIDP